VGGDHTAITNLRRAKISHTRDPKSPILAVVIFSVLLFSDMGHAETGSFDFEGNSPLAGWQTKRYLGKVIYKIASENSNNFVHAVSKNAATALYKRIRFDARKTPIISWRWKVDQFPKKQGLGSAEDDDYAARVYVIFISWFFPSSKCIEYIFDDETKEGTILDNPYSRNIKLYVIRSGREKNGRWFREERNIYEDYLEAFGEKPVLKIGAVAFMVDSDNTKSYAEASFDDLMIGYEKNGRVK